MDHAPGSHDDIANACAGVLATTFKVGNAPTDFYLPLKYPKIRIVPELSQTTRIPESGDRLNSPEEDLNKRDVRFVSTADIRLERRRNSVEPLYACDGTSPGLGVPKAGKLPADLGP